MTNYFKANWEGTLNLSHGFMHYFYDKLSKFFNYQFKLAVFLIKGRNVTVAYDLENLQNLGHLVINKILDDEKYLDFLIKEYDKDVKIFKKLLDKIDNTELSKTSYKELISLYIELLEKANTLIPPSFAEPVSILIRDYIEEELSNCIEDEQKIKEYLSVLLQSHHFSFLEEEKLNRLKILKKIQEKKLKFNNLKSDLEVFSMLKQHKKDYGWIRNNYYRAKDLKIDFFIGSLKELSKENSEYDKKDIKKAKREVLKLFANPKLNLLSRITEEFIFIHDNRKKWLLIYQKYLWLILDEFARRKSLSREEIGWYTIDEVKKGTSLSKDKIKERKKLTVLIYHNGKKDILVGDKGKKWENKLLNNIKPNIKELKGVPACPGKVKGTVKILKDTTELSKLKKGDILVASNTTPDYLPAMKKAAAFLTEKGGITSHAAIVSREMNKPCIVGINNITIILKDNDLIEADAEKGIVRILKRKK